MCVSHNLNNTFVYKISVSPPYMGKTDFYIFIFYLFLDIFKIENKSQINNNLIKTTQAFNNTKTNYSKMSTIYHCNQVIINNHNLIKPSYRDVLTSQPVQPSAPKVHSEDQRSTGIGSDANNFMSP